MTDKMSDSWFPSNHSLHVSTSPTINLHKNYLITEHAQTA